MDFVYNAEQELRKTIAGPKDPEALKNTDRDSSSLVRRPKRSQRSKLSISPFTAWPTTNSKAGLTKAKAMQNR
jgi:hypothetical protein